MHRCQCRIKCTHHIGHNNPCHYIRCDLCVLAGAIFLAVMYALTFHLHLFCVCVREKLRSERFAWHGRSIFLNEFTTKPLTECQANTHKYTHTEHCAQQIPSYTRYLFEFIYPALFHRFAPSTRVCARVCVYSLVCVCVRARVRPCACVRARSFMKYSHITLYTLTKTLARPAHNVTSIEPPTDRTNVCARVRVCAAPAIIGHFT